MDKLDKMYSDLLLLGYEGMLLDTLSDKEICELWHSKKVKENET